MSQPAPAPGEKLVAELVIENLESLLTSAGQEEVWEELSGRLLVRIQAGHEKYGVFLMTYNGRDALEDAFDEAADLVMYLTQAQMEGAPINFQRMQAENLLTSITQAIQMRKAPA